MKQSLSLLLLSLIITACGGGGGGGGGGVRYYSHQELANKFVSNLNLDYDFNVSLVKTHTEQTDYIVIYDPYTLTYDAINLDYYDPLLDNAADYYYNNSSASFFNLQFIPGGWDVEYEYELVYDAYYDDYYWDYVAYDVYVDDLYKDPVTGIVFEKTKGTQKDLAKVEALKEAAKIDKVAKHLSGELHLSLERATEIASLTAKVDKDGIKSMTEKELDDYSKELFGFTITDGKDAFTDSLSGDSSGINELLNTAAETNDISPEQATKLMTKFFAL